MAGPAIVGLEILGSSHWVCLVLWSMKKMRPSVCTRSSQPRIRNKCYQNIQQLPTCLHIFISYLFPPVKSISWNFLGFFPWNLFHELFYRKFAFTFGQWTKIIFMATVRNIGLLWQRWWPSSPRINPRSFLVNMVDKKHLHMRKNNDKINFSFRFTYIITCCDF